MLPEWISLVSGTVAGKVVTVTVEFSFGVIVLIVGSPVKKVLLHSPALDDR